MYKGETLLGNVRINVRLRNYRNLLLNSFVFVSESSSSYFKFCENFLLKKKKKRFFLNTKYNRILYDKKNPFFLFNLQTKRSRS